MLVLVTLLYGWTKENRDGCWRTLAWGPVVSGTHRYHCASSRVSLWSTNSEVTPLSPWLAFIMLLDFVSWNRPHLRRHRTRRASPNSLYVNSRDVFWDYNLHQFRMLQTKFKYITIIFYYSDFISGSEAVMFQEDKHWVSDISLATWWPPDSYIQQVVLVTRPTAVFTKSNLWQSNM